MTRALVAHRFLARAGIGLAGIFSWLFLFEYFTLLSHSPVRALIGVGIVYALAQGITILLTPLSAAHLRRGMRRHMAIGALFAALAFAILGSTFAGTMGYVADPWTALAFAILMGAYRALYWTPYRVERSQFPGVMGFWLEIILALLPMIAGAIIAAGPLGHMNDLFTAAVFLIFSIVPLYMVPDHFERFSWSYLETFNQLFAQRNRAIAIHAFFDGIESAALYLIWPFAIFLILNGSYIALGFVFTATLLLLLAVHRPLRLLMRRARLHESDAARVVIAVSGWVFRIAAGTGFAIILADSYSYVGSNRGREAALLEHPTESATFVDEYSVLKELALALGRVVMVAFFMLFVGTLPLATAFVCALIIAAIAAAAAALLYRHARLAL